MEEKQILLRVGAINNAIADGLPGQEIFHRIVASVQAIGFDRVRLDLLTDDRAFVETVAACGFDEAVARQRVSASDDTDLELLRTDPRPQIFTFGEAGLAERGCLPVLLQGEIIGRLWVDNAQSRKPLDSDRLQDATPFARQAAIAQLLAPAEGGASSRTPRSDEAKLWADSLETLQRISLAITSVRGRAEVLATIIEQAVKLLQAKSGGIYEYRPDRGELTIIADYNRPVLLGKTLGLGTGIAGRLISRQEPFIVVDDYDRWEGRSPIFGEAHYFGAVLEVPLRWEGNTIGVLYVDDLVGRHFSAKDARLLGLLADQAAVAMINTTLLHEEEKKLQRLERLSLATHEMMENLDAVSLGDRLSLIAKHAAEILEAEAVGVFLAREGELILKASYGHSEGKFQQGKRVPIRSESGGGLTGHIAYTGELFNAYGEALTSHVAVSHARPHTPSGACYSLLAIPLKKDEKLIGLLRADNKKGDDGLPRSSLGFTKEDEWILRIFSGAAAVAIESAELVARLKVEQDFQQRLISSSPDGVIAVDQQARIVEFNKRAEEILGFSRDEVLGQPVSAIYFDPTEPRRIGSLLQAAYDGHLRNYETTVRNKVSEMIPILHSSTWLFNAEGERIGSVGYFEDLRAQKALERRESVLLAASNVLAHADSLDEGLQRLAEMMVARLGRSYCGILLIGDGESLILRAESLSGQPNWRPGRQRIILSEWPGLGELLELGSPRVLSWTDTRVQPLLGSLAHRLSLPEELRTLLIVPLKVGNRVVGQIDLGDLPSSGGTSFSAEEVDLISAIAVQITVLIDRFHLLETTTRKEELLEALVQASLHVRADVEMATLLQVIVRLAVELVHCSVGGLFLNRPFLGQLELAAVYGAPEHLIGEHLSHEEGLIGLVAREGVHSVGPLGGQLFGVLELPTMAAVPLRGPAGEIDAVLFVGDSFERALSSIDVATLTAFATQATIALRTARLMDRELRYFSQFTVLYQISDYIQRAHELDDILHPVLTGVTASYGLGFNRAVLMLVDETGKQLLGRMGLGELDEEHARSAWRSDREEGINNFDLYLRRLEKEAIKPTALDKKIKSLHLSLGGNDLFSEIVATRRFRRIPVAEFNRLPEVFLTALRVSTPLVVAPLVVKDQVLGILVADNKFTQAPIGDESCNALMIFTATAAVAIDNRRLFDQTRSSAEKVMAFYQMSGELIALKEPRRILKRIVDQTMNAAGASWVNIVLIEKDGRPRNPISSGRYTSWSPGEPPLPIRANGISIEVMRTGQAVTIENVENMRERVNPILIDRSIRSAICLPLSLPGQRIGVMWIHYDEPRRFTEFEIAALQLYVNQAAIAFDSARRLEKLEDLEEVSVALAEAEDLRSVLEQTVTGARRVLKADAAVLWSYDDKTDSFIPESSVYSGAHPQAWAELRNKGGILRRGTAFRIMKQGWVPVEDVHLESGGVVGPMMERFFDQIGTRSFQGFALKVGREKLGALLAIYTEPSRFDDEERERALTFANRAALALKKAKLFDQVERTRKAAEVVARVTLLEDQGNTLMSIARETRDALDCGAVILFQYDQETGRLNLPPAMVGIMGPVDQTTDYPLVLSIVERDRPYIVTDVSSDEEFKSSRFAHSEGLKSCVAIPLKAAGLKVGGLFICYRVPRQFTADELTNMELFSNQAAVAIRNSQLFQGRASKLAQHETLASLSKELLGAKSFQETMDRAVEFTARVLATEFSCIVLPDREGRLLFSAAFGWEPEMVGAFFLEPGEGSHTGYTIWKKAPVAVFDYALVKEFRVPEVIARHGIHSGLSVPMFREGKIVGAMLVHTSRARRFTRDDETLLSLAANQTAIALEREMQYEASMQKRSYLTALYEASKALAAQFGPERRQILEQITQFAVQGILGGQDPKAVWGTLELYQEDKDELVLESVYPPEQYTEVVSRIGERRCLKSAQGRIGITGRTILSGAPQISYDVRADVDYIEYFPTTLSEVVVPLVDRDRNAVIGALNAESNRIYAFDDDDQEALQALAELAVVALQNSRQAEELKEAMEAQKALAWMGIGNANLRHEVNDYIGRIRVHLHLLRNSLESGGASSSRSLILPLEDMEKEVEQILTRLRTLSRTGKDEITSIPVNTKLIRNRKRKLKGSQMEDIPLAIRCELKDDATVRANAYWLNRAIDILLRNAIEATRNQTEREIILGARGAGERVEIYVDDNGKGVPVEIRQKLFRARIKQAEKQRMGMGLLAAHAMVQIYDGHIRYKERQPRGTSIIISLPLEGKPV